MDCEMLFLRVDGRCCRLCKKASLLVQVNVYELLAELLETSGADPLDSEDPARMHASVKVKLAEITEVDCNSHIIAFITWFLGIRSLLTCMTAADN